MKKRSTAHSSDLKAAPGYSTVQVSVGAAILLALYGTPSPAGAEEPADLANGSLQEIIVTATRRQEALEAVPYSITAVGADEISRTGVTDIASLANQVPGLTEYDFGARLTSAVFPIIRGLNASTVSAGFRTFEQSPVGTYIDNSPISGYFQLNDIQRVEVLRGPQGTLYGAGALGGALRIIPNAPELNKFAGDLELGGGTVAHSGDAAYSASAMLNVPFGSTLALRLSGKYEYDPGFIDVYGILQRPGSPAGGIPTIADPADPVNSSGVIRGKNNWDDQKTFTGRASLLWQPTDAFNAQLAVTYGNLTGDGGPTANSTFPGGPYPLDPRITFPSGGDYQEFSAVDQPYSRKTTLESLDLSYDAGFATLSSTSSYFTTYGTTVEDVTYGLAALPAFVGYYAGSPANPRYVNPSVYGDSEHNFTQELRLVSNAGPDRKLDYVLGLYYEDQGRQGSWTDSNPGSPERSIAQGCTAPYYYNYATNSPSTFPNCLLTSGPGDVHFYDADAQHFTDKSEFGELTWHFLPKGQVTFGGRHFEQSFADQQVYNAYTFDTLLPVVARHSSASKNTWKADLSYQYATNQYAYVLWSQGFRRGGANSLPTTGIYRDNPVLQTYAPDSVNNYEVGLKGRLENGLTYTIDAFDIDWDKPQVGGLTPIGNFAVWNANKAKSTGVEFDLNSPLFVPGLHLNASAAYADARFSEKYAYATYEGGSALVPDAIVGNAGQQLPGSPKTSAAATITYDWNIAADYKLSLSLNDTYRSAMALSTFPSAYTPFVPAVTGMNIQNLSASVRHGSWRLGAYVTNLLDKRIVLVPGGLPTQIEGLGNDATINRPREIQIRLGYSL